MQRIRLLALASVALAVAGGPAPAAEQLADGIAAQVGSEVVLVSEVMRMSRGDEAQLRAQGAPETELAKARASALEHMIEAKLLARVVKQSDLHAKDSEVDDAIAGIAKENGLTVEQLKASVNTHDMTFAEYREQIRQELERRKVIQSMIAARVRIDESDVKQMYTEQFSNQPEGGETVHVRQIIVVFGEEVGRDKAQACQIAKDSLARIRAGESFEDVAKEVSAVAPMDGGDIGWIHADSMASWMKTALAPLKDGGVSDVIELPFGCGVMKLVERREWTPITYDKAKPRLEELVYEQKLASEYRKWMDQLRQNTFIERRGYFADAARLDGSSLAGKPADDSAQGGTGQP